MSPGKDRDDDLFMVRMACRIGFKLYFASCPVVGVEHIPEASPCILALNHRSILDPGLIWSYFPAPIYFLFREDFGGFPLIGWAARQLEQIAIRRDDADVPAFKQAIRYLTELRRSVGVFVEGTRAVGPGMNPPKQGCALLAARTRVPVLPAFIQGLDVALPKGRIVPTYTRRLSIRLGPPVVVDPGSSQPDREQLEHETRRIVDAIRALDPLRPVLAGGMESRIAPQAQHEEE